MVKSLEARLTFLAIASTALGLVQCTSDNDKVSSTTNSAGTFAGGQAGTYARDIVAGSTATGGTNHTGTGLHSGAAAGAMSMGGAAGNQNQGAFAGAAGASEPLTRAKLHSILIGSFSPLTGYSGTSGSALMVRTLDGHTRVSVQLLGLAGNTTYPVHVHAAPCAQGAAAGHYKIDPTITETVQTNEIWLPFTTDAAGTGVVETDIEHLARGDALAVVVHDPNATNAPKMACADLLLADAGDLLANGKFASFAQAEAADRPIAGTAQLERSIAGTRIEYLITGLNPAASYVSHVHALPCAVNAAGAHYKVDTTNATTLETNEFWLPVTTSATGSASGSLAFAPLARLDAQSVVIHRVDTTTLKVACANLIVEEYPALVLRGSSGGLPTATERGFGALTTMAQLTRKLDGTTAVQIRVQGLAAQTAYPAHVHNLPCSAQTGGAHYKRNMAETSTVASNELWLGFTTDSNGAGVGNLVVEYTPRADARSIVVHDSTADAARLACIDLGI